MILLIDNYDSFTYNLYQQVSHLGENVKVIRNDEKDLIQVRNLKPQKIIISPGPKTPVDSGISIPIIKEFSSNIPILGICLGHQCLAVAFGSNIRSAAKLVFGKTTWLKHNNSRLLSDIPTKFLAARYHSLVIDEAPENFDATSYDDDGDIMSIEHNTLPVFGLQFHPESFLMQSTGDSIIQKFLDI